MELSERVQFSFVGQNLQKLGRETIGPYRLSVRQRTDGLLYFVPRRVRRPDLVPVDQVRWRYHNHPERRPSPAEGCFLMAGGFC